MSELIQFEPTAEQFGPFWKYIEDPSVTDIDYNGSKLWITDFARGRYQVEEEITENFISAFTHTISNSVNKQFNNVNKVLEADTKELRISIVHESVTATGISICIRKSPAIVRNTIQSMIDTEYCSEECIHLLLNCIRVGMNFVIGGEPGSGKTEFSKFLMQFIPKEDRVITIEDSFEIHYSDINPGADAVEMRVSQGFDYIQAIRTCLRQNPKWMMLSEVRSREVTALLEQWSTGLSGITTLHLDDVRKAPDRILNMMDDTNDVERMKNRIFRYVNVGVLIRRTIDADGRIKRSIDQLCFYSREKHKNEIKMIVDDAELVSRELPAELAKKFSRVGIDDPFYCNDYQKYIEEGK